MNEYQQGRVIAWYNEGVLTREIARRLGYSDGYIRGTISYLRKEHPHVVGRRWGEKKKKIDERFYRIVENVVSVQDWDKIIDLWEEEIHDRKDQG